ncbi:MAG: MFS transporter [Gemmatimonadaceae bacterium]
MHSKRVFAIACMGMLSFGVVLTTLGALLPGVVTQYQVSMAQAGSLFLLMTFGILAGSLVFGPIVDRRGYKGMMLFALVAIVIGLQAIAFAPSFAWLRAAVLFIGFGGGIVNGGANALVADISSDQRGAGLALLGVFFGIGAAGMPFALWLLDDTFSRAAILASIGVLLLVPVVLTLTTLFPSAKQTRGFPLAQARGLLGDRVLLLMGLMLFLESGMEITVGGWTTSYFINELGIAEATATIYLSLYWLGMMLARLTLGVMLRRASAAMVLLACIGIALAGSLLLVSTSSVVAASVAVFLLGVGFAAGFPVILGLVGDRHPQLSGTAFSLVIVMALVGGMTLPYVTGVLGGSYGLRGSFLIVPLALVLMATLLGIVSRRLAPAASAAPAGGASTS